MGSAILGPAIYVVQTEVLFSSLILYDRSSIICPAPPRITPWSIPFSFFAKYPGRSHRREQQLHTRAKLFKKVLPGLTQGQASITH
jgi:hypothetical protein